MNIRLIAVAMVSAAAALSAPAFAQDYGQQTDARSTTAPAPQRNFRGAYNQAQFASPTQSGPEFYTGWNAEGGIDRSRPGGLDPDLRPSGN